MGSSSSLPSSRTKQHQQQQGHCGLIHSSSFKKLHQKNSSSLIKTVSKETVDSKLSIQDHHHHYKKEEVKETVTTQGEQQQQQQQEEQEHQYEQNKLIDELQDCNDDPMLAAANKLSQQFEKERAALMHTTTCEPCIIAAYKEHSSNASYPSSSGTTINDRFMKMFPKAKVSDYASQKELMLYTFTRNITDVERRKERDRQQRLHYTLKRAFNGIHRAKVEDPEIIVDWSSGAGMWDMEMSEKFPDCKIIAIDCKQNALAGISSRFPNIEFRYSALDETDTGMESIDSNTVDYVMMKDCWLINSPSYKWTYVLNQAFRILKPNGWIELSESALRLESQGKQTAQLDKWFRVFFKEMDIDRNISEKLGDFLKLAGFISIDQTSYTVPVGEWPTSKESKETGYLFRDMLEKKFRFLAKMLSVLNDVEEDEIQRVITISLEEEAQANCSHVDWISYTARKPAMDNSASVGTSKDASALQSKSSKSLQI